jgi:hypothetical protein
MSKYLHQYCNPKPMNRVDINYKNQSTNVLLSDIEVIKRENNKNKKLQEKLEKK